MSTLYLDHAASTPIDAEAIDAMTALAREAFGHPSASHSFGRRVRSRVESARVQVAEYVGCDASQLAFARSGTHAMITAIQLAAEHSSGPILSTAIEHPAARDTLDELSRHGRSIKLLPARGGQLDVNQHGADFAEAGVVVLAPMNQELGTTLDLPSLFSLAPNALWVCDAVQAAAWMNLDALMIDRSFVAVSGHKLGGPPGVGALRVPPPFGTAAGTTISPIPGIESGLDWLAVVGLAAACHARLPRRDAARLRAIGQGQRLMAGLQAARPGGQRNAGPTWLGPILSIAWPDLAGRMIEHILDLEGVAISRTSACRQRFDSGSAVVLAAYPDEPWRAQGATRWSLGWSTTDHEIDEAVQHFAAQFGQTAA